MAMEFQVENKDLKNISSFEAQILNLFFDWGRILELCRQILQIDSKNLTALKFAVNASGRLKLPDVYKYESLLKEINKN